MSKANFLRGFQHYGTFTNVMVKRGKNVFLLLKLNPFRYTFSLLAQAIFQVAVPVLFPLFYLLDHDPHPPSGSG